MVSRTGTRRRPSRPAETPAVGAEPTRSDRIRTLMARMAEGDVVAAFDLMDEFGSEIAAMIRRVLRDRGARPEPAEVEEIVVDVVLDLHERAGSWRPEGGAPPWRWARMRIQNHVDAHIGQWCSSLDAAGGVILAEASTLVGAPVDEPVEVVMERLAESEPLIALLDAALREVASDRDLVLLLEGLVEEGGGSPCPSDVVARAHGLAPATVRKQRSRVLRRLRDLVQREPTYAPLAALALLGDSSGDAQPAQPASTACSRAQR